jgi:hypothetical protein
MRGGAAGRKNGEKGLHRPPAISQFRFLGLKDLQVTWSKPASAVSQLQFQLNKSVRAKLIGFLQ